MARNIIDEMNRREHGGSDEPIGCGTWLLAAAIFLGLGWLWNAVGADDTTVTDPDAPACCEDDYHVP